MKIVGALAIMFSSSSCFIFTGEVACETNANCPSIKEFCRDRGDGQLFCSGDPGEPCASTPDCAGNDPAVFCTIDVSDGQRFCTDFCDGENACDNSVGEFCFQEACTVDVGCDDDADCGDDEFALCLLDPALVLSCVRGDRADTCSGVDDRDCTDRDFLCETAVYGFCMDPNNAVGSCDAGDNVTFGADYLTFIESAEIGADCADAGLCVDVVAVILRSASGGDAALFANDQVNSAVADFNGNVQIVNGIADQVVDPASDAQRASVTFRINSDRVASTIAISFGTQTLGDGGSGLSNAACFAVE